LRVKKKRHFSQFKEKSSLVANERKKIKKKQPHARDYTTDAPYSHPECKKALTAPPTAGALLLKLAALSALLIFFFFFVVVVCFLLTSFTFSSFSCLGFFALFKTLNI